MGKVLKLATVVASSMCFAAQTGVAQGQTASNSQLMLSPVVERLSASDISDILAKYEITTQLIPYEGQDAATLAASTEGGGKFLVSLFGCEDPTTGADCRGAATYTAFSNAGMAYDDINTFNTDAQVAKAVNVAEQNIIVFGIQRFFNGGVSRDNIEFEMILFLNDMQGFLENRQTGATSISDRASEKPGGKTDNVIASGTTGTVSLRRAGAVSTSGAIAAAIANTGNASFVYDAD